MSSIKHRLGRLEALLEARSAKPFYLEQMTDDELWAEILTGAGVSASPTNIAAHVAYNDSYGDTIWVNVGGEWVDSLADRRCGYQGSSK